MTEEKEILTSLRNEDWKKIKLEAEKIYNYLKYTNDKYH